MKYRVAVNCNLNRSYETDVEAEDEEMALIAAEAEIYTKIDPIDIDVFAYEAEEIDE